MCFHIISENRLQRMLGEAFERGIQVRSEFEAHGGPRSGIHAGYDMDRALLEIMRKKARKEGMK